MGQPVCSGRCQGWVAFMARAAFNIPKQTVTATISVGEEAMSTIVGLLKQFPNGSQVRLAFSPLSEGAPGVELAEYRSRIASARQKFAANCPWISTAEAMLELRGGEKD